MASDYKLRSISQIKRNILYAAFRSGEGHIPSAFSIVDIVYGFYESRASSKLNGEDVFILSKGHASLALYAVLSHFGYITDDWKENFAKYGSNYGGHPDMLKVPEVFASTGSLGHGFPISLGVALGRTIRQENGNVFVLIGDGELNEGSNWETLLLWEKFQLENLVLIIDSNHSTDRAIDLGDIRKKLSSFSFAVIEINGHSPEEVSKIFTSKVPKNGKRIYVAHTVKGRGIAEMESNPAWHHAFPNKEEYERFSRELS